MTEIKYEFKDTSTWFVNAIRSFLLAFAPCCSLVCTTPVNSERKFWNVGKTVIGAVESMFLDIDPFDPPVDKLTAKIDIMSKTNDHTFITVSDVIFSDGKAHFAAKPTTRIGILNTKNAKVKVDFKLEILPSQEKKVSSNLDCRLTYEGDDPFPDVIDLTIDVTNTSLKDPQKYIEDCFELLRNRITDYYLRHLEDPFSEIIKSETKGNQTVFIVKRERNTLISIIASQTAKLFPPGSPIIILPSHYHLCLEDVKIVCTSTNSELKDDPEKMTQLAIDSVKMCFRSFIDELDAFLPPPNRRLKRKKKKN